MRKSVLRPCSKQGLLHVQSVADGGGAMGARAPMAPPQFSTPDHLTINLH